MPDTLPGPPERTGAGKRTNLGGENEAATKVTGSKSSPSALPDSPTEIVTRSGFCFSVRPVTAADQAGLAELMAAVSEDDIRFRFVTAGERTLERMSRVDHDRTENFVAIDGSMTMVATAMLASGASGKEAEVAIAVRADCRHQGIGWMLLDYVVHYAARHGLSSLESTQSRDDRTVIDLEREMGFIASAYPGDPSRVLLTKSFAARGLSGI
jgi:acetyltransferase